MNNDAVRKLLDAVGALAEMSLNFYRAVLNAGATKEEAFVLLQSFISASIHGSKEESDEDCEKEPSPYFHRSHGTDQGEP